LPDFLQGKKEIWPTNVERGLEKKKTPQSLPLNGELTDQLREKKGIAEGPEGGGK